MTIIYFSLSTTSNYFISNLYRWLWPRARSSLSVCIHIYPFASSVDDAGQNASNAKSKQNRKRYRVVTYSRSHSWRSWHDRIAVSLFVYLFWIIQIICLSREFNVFVVVPFCDVFGIVVRLLLFVFCVIGKHNRLHCSFERVSVLHFVDGDDEHEKSLHLTFHISHSARAFGRESKVMISTYF